MVLPQIMAWLFISFQQPFTQPLNKISDYTRPTFVTFSAKNRPFWHTWYFEKYHFETLKPVQFSCAVF